jgi:hypothetical protein
VWHADSDGDSDVDTHDADPDPDAGRLGDRDARHLNQATVATTAIEPDGT